jgi:hypothetical protein
MGSWNAFTLRNVSNLKLSCSMWDEAQLTSQAIGCRYVRFRHHCSWNGCCHAAGWGTVLGRFSQAKPTEGTSTAKLRTRFCCFLHPHSVVAGKNTSHLHLAACLGGERIHKCEENHAERNVPNHAECKEPKWLRRPGAGGICRQDSRKDPRSSAFYRNDRNLTKIWGRNLPRTEFSS